MKSRLLSNLLKTVFGFVVVCCVLFCGIAALLFWMADPYYLKAPSDQKLITRFLDHRAAFEELREMAADDSKQEGYFNEHLLNKKFPWSRRQEYKHLKAEIYPSFDIIIWATVKGPNNVVRFVFAGGGLSAIGPEWTKGIEYIPGDDDDKDEAQLLPSLDQPGALPYGMYVREIEPHWFIFYNYMD
jgi:hypothetical protein